MRVSANGGTPELIIRTGESEQMYGPQLLPDRDSVLFSVTSEMGPTRWDQGQVVVQSLSSGKRSVVVQGGHVTVPKGGRLRQLPMTQRLTAALKAARHLRSARLLSLRDGSPLTRDRVIKAIRGAQRVAGLVEQGVHILRHTFCSHLAMRGAPARAIEELAGYADLSTTQVHASESGGDRGRDSAVGWTSDRCRIREKF